MKTAIISGATGLIGNELMHQLLNSSDYNQVIAVVREPLELKHPKLIEKIIDFESLSSDLVNITAHQAFCCLGTTIKTAGSKERQYRIDHDYVVEFAKATKAIGVEQFAVVSSIGANQNSSNFYLKTKGQMETDVLQIPFKSICIVRPSILFGNRKEFRFMEKVSIRIMKLLNPLFIGSIRKYRGVEASKVAACMIATLNNLIEGISIVESDKI